MFTRTRTRPGGEVKRPMQIYPAFPVGKYRGRINHGPRLSSWTELPSDLFILLCGRIEAENYEHLQNLGSGLVFLSLPRCFKFPPCECSTGYECCRRPDLHCLVCTSHCSKNLAELCAARACSLLDPHAIAWSLSNPNFSPLSGKKLHTSR